MKQVTIYSTPTCHFCMLVKDYMKANNIPYTEHDVASDLEKRKEMIDKSGQMGVPVMDIEGKIIVGFDENEFAEVVGIK
ncbi:MAG: glutaredoxin family protein [bacterium]|nr:glutaredoxin family protein [bacterium]